MKWKPVGKLVLRKISQIFCYVTSRTVIMGSFTFFWLALLLANAYAQTCIPLARGVPGELFGKPPNWWDPTPGFPFYDTRIDAPNWRGAVAVTYPDGGAGATTEHVSFRALHHIVSGEKSLYLSIHSKVVPDLTHDNLLYIGFRDESTLGQDVIIEIKFTTSSDQTAGMTYDARVFVKNSGVTAWILFGAVPTWLTEAGRVWMTGLPQTWAIHLKIPITTSPDLTNGINVEDNFRMWFEVRVGQIAGGSTDYTPYKWPREIADVGAGSSGIPGFPATTNGMDDETWEEMQIGTSGSCTAEGIAILASDVGTTNTVPHQINLTGVNTFFARPRNQTTSPISGIRARFRIANWGSHSTREEGVPMTELWQDIASPIHQPPSGISIPASDQGEISFDWTVPDPTLFQPECPVPGGTSPDPNKRSCHQCILVELTGPGATFINSSVYRNMDFVSASRFSRDAEISIKGLSLQPMNDVYLYVVTSNLPRKINRREEKARQKLSREIGFNRFEQALVPTPATGSVPQRRREHNFEDLMKVLPTYQVHAYYDTGLRQTENGITKAILRPLTSFGYFLNHQGDLDGWRHELKNAEQIAPNYYRISVPNDSFSVVITEIEAIEPKSLALSFHFGIDLPHGDIGDFYDPGFAGTFDIALRLSRSMYLEGLFGWHHFKGKNQVGDLSISQLAGNLKYVFPSYGRTHLFMNGGGGAYHFESGSTKMGYNVGSGIQVDLSSVVALEAAYNYHSILDTDPSFRFSTIQGVLRFRF